LRSWSPCRSCHRRGTSGGQQGHADHQPRQRRLPTSLARPERSHESMHASTLRCRPRRVKPPSPRHPFGRMRDKMTISTTTP
jgi:hypothetical protein